MRKALLLIIAGVVLAGCVKEPTPTPLPPLDYDYTGRVYASIPNPPSTLCQVYEFISKDSLTYQYRKQSWDGEPLSGNVYKRGYYYDYYYNYPSIFVKHEDFESDSSNVTILTIGGDSCLVDIFNKFYYRYK